MRILRLITLLLGSSALLFGQLDSGSLTVTATRSISLQPDQAVIGVAVVSGLDGSLEEILGSIADAGISEADFSGVTELDTPASPGLRWDFNLTVPIAQLSDTLSLLRAQQLTFAVRGSRVSAASRDSESCSQADLVADATIQARKLAVDAGVALGAVLSVAEGGSIGNSVQGIVLAGSFSFTATSEGRITFDPLPPTGPIVCSLTVKFSIGR